MNAVQILKTLHEFLSYDYDSSIKKDSYHGQFEIYRMGEFSKLTYNPILNFLLFRDERGNEWIYTDKTGVNYFFKEFDSQLFIPSGSTIYGSNRSIKHTQTAEEIFHLAIQYFVPYIRTPIYIPVMFPKKIYKEPLIELFSPICEYRYTIPILILYTESEPNFLDYCVEIMNKDCSVSFSESYSNECAVSFVDEKGNKWLYTDSEKRNFVRIKNGGHELEYYERGIQYYNENNTYIIFTNSKEEVYEKAFAYFSTFIKNKKHRKYKINFSCISNN
ncbi:hypothetical protein V3468_10185 [Flavobacterium oreochromis]|uniref:hypothetical protein n=1 Tax=Flavobacterium oreochromis TaxID=2906078 RepID=UPI00385A6601